MSSEEQAQCLKADLAVLDPQFAEYLFLEQHVQDSIVLIEPLETCLEASKCSAYLIHRWDFDLCYDRSFPLSGSNSSEAIRDGSFHRRIRQILTTQTTLTRKWTLNPGIDLSLRMEG